MTGTAEAALPPLPSDDEILRGVTRAALKAGYEYAHAGRVRRLTRSADGLVLEAEVKGTARKPYAQHVRLRPGKAVATPFQGTCTCPVGLNCKHVAAVLIAAREQAMPSPPPRRTDARTAPVPPVVIRAPAVPPRPAEPALPYQVAEWLRRIGAEDAEDPEAYPATVRQRLLYVVGLTRRPGGLPAAEVRPMVVNLKKDGSLGAMRDFGAHMSHAAAYLRPSDRAILERLSPLRYATPERLAQHDLPDLLRRMLATGRARWQDPHGPALAEGPPRPGRLDWDLLPDGSQRPALRLEEGVTGLALPQPWYVDPAAGLAGPVDLGLSPHLAGELLAAPPIPAEVVPVVQEALSKRVAAPAVALPAALQPAEPLQGPPVPRLLLTALELPSLPRGRGIFGDNPEEDEAVPIARLGFRYGPVVVPWARGPRGPATVAREGRLYSLRRDETAERAALRRLEGIGFAPMVGTTLGLIAPQGDAFVLSDDDWEEEEAPDWIFVLQEEVPALRAAGWEVEVAPDFPIRLIEPEGPLEARLEEGSGIDWLDLHLGVTVGGERIDLVPVLVRLLQAGAALLPEDAEADTEPLVLPLPDGRLLQLPREQILPILRVLEELFEEGAFDGGSGGLRFTRQDAAELARLEAESGIAWQGGEALRALGAQLRAAEGRIPEAAVPASFLGTLRPYQQQGVAWLQFLRAAGLGGVLADDMGLGKTVQTLAHLAIEQAAGRLDRPALILCPTSLVPNWTREAARFAPTLKVLPLHGPQRKSRFGEIAQHDLVISTYPLLVRDQEALTAQDWHLVALDEAQTIKNPNAETTRQALRLRAGQRLCLSGTPLQNHLGELWSLFDFLAPGFLGSAKDFRARYRTPIEKHGDPQRQAALHRRIRPFLLRRTKEEVAKELPPKTEITEPVEMEAPQRAVYEAIRLSMHARVKQAIAEKGLARSGIIILDALLKLRQACCDPRLLKMKSSEKAGSAKLERLLELLPVLLGEGRRVLLFSQFTSMLALIETALDKAGIPHLLLTGSTKDRATPVRRFQAGEVPVFLISLKAGGVGLNLTAADTVIHYDPWWNPAAEDQATDRAHRIGQEKPVFVHRLVTLGTIEEKMEELKEKKRALVAAVLGAEEGGALKLTEAEVEELFAAA
ncbi:DEAD/DEAH box helicase [Paracraurococcus lichenis]|uniref:DEAD/DEAH box helicase n=1 Tax=Paracraurococcus lichenis TaxID=3064888 RepID=A0ABT9DTK3_9PROT|nr:DEAD/DEAH box helicase [Paracraurococcus sp. LOR1-02]MDO9707208.1 DEAD/DEAH box helicase [Paracraurococcus sp. LOR1-02]